jgi:hypothetical protein
LQSLLNDIYQSFIGGLNYPISLRVVSCGVSQSNVILDTKLYDIFGSEGCYIVSYDFSWTSKTRQNMIFHKFNDDRVSSLPTWYNFDPLCEIVDGSEDPPVLTRRGCISLMKSKPHCWKGDSTEMGFMGRGRNFLLPSKT